MSLKTDIHIDSVNAEDYVWNPVEKNQIAIRWLGQAGFQIIFKDYRLMIDPYLSDCLEKKYAGKEFPHVRMMSSPLIISEIHDLDFILCTHRHSDHVDPEAVPILLKKNPKCQIVVPRAEKEHVIKTLGINEKRVIFINADESIRLNDCIQIEAVPSAHEELQMDEQGNHRYLGYIIRFDDIVLYHSGDCIPYVSLPHELKTRGIDIALLPVNGRDEFRASKGVPGNFTFEEDVTLCEQAGVSTMICNHFGMFSFNTIDEASLRQKAKAAITDSFLCIVPDVEKIYLINPL